MIRADLKGASLAVLAAAILTGASTTAYAQAANGGDSASVGEVVVTARRVTERLQDVPASIAAIGRQELQARQINQINDLKNFVPNLTVFRTAVAGGGNIAIRGVIGAGLPNVTADGATGRYLDGVYIARNGGSSFQLPDIERIEVLRGPQGTLFGRNVTGGAVNFLTRDPSGVFSLEAAGTLGNYERRRGRVSLETPEVSGFAARVTYMHDEQKGAQKNSAAGRRYIIPAPFGAVKSSDGFGDIDTDNLFAAIRYTGVDNLVLSYKFDYAKSAQTPPSTQALGIPSSFSGLLYANYVLAQPAGAVPIGPSRLRSLPMDFAGASNVKVQGHNFTAQYDFNEHLSVKNIFGYRTVRATSRTDLDGGFLTTGAPLPFPINFILAAPIGFPQPVGSTFCAGCSVNVMNQKQWSEELQLIGTTEKLDFIIGGYYFREKAGMNIFYSANGKYMFPAPAITPVNPAIDQFLGGNDRAVNKSKALYGSFKFRPVEKLELSGGARYTKDKRLTRNLGPNFAGLYTYEDSDVNWDASVTFELAPDVKVYARYATAYLSGGILTKTVFGPEHTRSVEAGIKSEFFDRRVRLNATVFHTKTKDLQVQSFTTAAGFVVENVGSQTIDGIEVETNFRVSDHASAGVNLGYNRPDFSDDRRNPVPKLNATGYVDFAIAEFGNGARLSFRGDADFRSKYFGVPKPLQVDQTPLGPLGTGFHLPAAFLASQGYASEAAYVAALDKAATLGNYWLVNARLTLADLPLAERKTRVSVWVKNLFDSRKPYFASNFGNIIGASFEEPRTYGVDFGITF